MSTRPAVRQLGRLSEIAQVAAKHGFGYLFDARRRDGFFSRHQSEIEAEEGSTRGQRLRAMLDELGPTFVKFGQLLSTRPDVVPPDIVFEPEPPAARPRGGVRSFVDELFYAGVGAVALTKDRIDELVDELAGRGELTRDEARDVVEGMTARWQGEASRVGERASVGLAGVLRELGLVTRREWEELELRLAQVEHRLRLVEQVEADVKAPPRGGARRLRGDGRT